jgi:hypothetical protein
MKIYKQVHPEKWNTIILLVAAFIAVGTYILFSFHFYKIGFPLDDSWIHQTFARNLIQYGQMAYLRGQPTSGSTSPLWVILISISYLLKIGPYAFPFLINMVILFYLGLFAEKIARNEQARYLPTFPIIGILAVFEWHFIWAAASGMETLLFTLFLLIIIMIVLSNLRWRWFLSGLLVGIAIWLRPEGLTLIAIPFWFVLFQKSNLKSKLLNLLTILVVVSLLIFPYFLYNYFLSHSLFPNTFLAKQMEYVSMLNENVLIRALNLFIQPFRGVGIILLPGFIYQIFLYIKQKRWALLGIVLWFIGFISIYVIKMPVIYQNARYIIPTMIIPIVFGGMGSIYLIDKVKTRKYGPFISKIWFWSMISVLFVISLAGARTYAFDVAIIETEMVEVSKWISLYTPRGSLVAAHDIGALGYFGNRAILDLAGLTSPEVIPIIRDETKLKEFMYARNADYLMAFPDWYPELIKDTIPLFTSGGKFSPAAGGTNMQVYILANR